MTPAIPLQSQAELFDADTLGDSLGDAFCAANDADSRRPHGITLTPLWLVERMLDEVQDGGFQTIVDCGAGTGRFAIAAALRFPKARIVAIEQHPELVLLLRRRIVESGVSQRVTVVEGDFREVHVPTRGKTLFIGNPPYVRHHDIAAEWKAWYQAGMTARGVVASQLAGLHAHFMLRASALMRPGDALCFVTSAEWLDNGYGRALRKLFGSTSGLAVRGLWVADSAQPVFADALVSSAVVHVASGQPGTSSRAGVIRDQSLLTLRQVAWAHLQDSARWSVWCRPTLAMVGQGVELGDLFRVTRGQVTGLNAAWVLGREGFDLPAGVCVTSVTRAKEIIQGLPLSQAGVEQLKCVVDLPADLDEVPVELRSAVQQFIARARAMGADQTYIARHRKAWWSVGMRAAPAAFVSYMGRRPPVFCANPWGASFINIAHGLYPRQAIADATLSRLLRHLNTTTDVNGGRLYGGGLAKFEPGDVSRLRIPPDLLEAQD